MKRCLKCSTEIEENAKFCGSCGEQVKNGEQTVSDYNFLYIPTSRLIWASVLSFGLYPIYWFASNWTAIGKVTGEKISPFWRGVFSIFYSRRPFTLALQQAKVNGYKTDININFLIGFYVMAVILNRVVDKIPETSWWFDLSWVVIGTLLMIYPLIKIQEAINWSSIKEGKIYKKVGLPEFGLIALIWALTILIAFSNT